MLVKINNSVYRVRWKHILPYCERRNQYQQIIRNAIDRGDQPPSPDINLDPKYYPWGASICQIEVKRGEDHPVEEWTLVSRSEKVCYWLDHFCKDVGRRYSLQDALHCVEFERPERALFWKAYWDRLPSQEDYEKALLHKLILKYYGEPSQLRQKVTELLDIKEVVRDVLTGKLESASSSGS